MIFVKPPILVTAQLCFSITVVSAERLSVQLLGSPGSRLLQNHLLSPRHLRARWRTLDYIEVSRRASWANPVFKLTTFRAVKLILAVEVRPPNCKKPYVTILVSTLGAPTLCKAKKNGHN